MNIPKSFKLNGQKYTVKRVNMDEEKLWGTVKPGTGLLRMHDAIPEREEGTVFYHELTHAILDHMGENEDRNNEGFVQGFAQLMNEYEISKRG